LLDRKENVSYIIDNIIYFTNYVNLSRVEFIHKSKCIHALLSYSKSVFLSQNLWTTYNNSGEDKNYIFFISVIGLGVHIVLT